MYVALTSLTLLCVVGSNAGDWPQFLGPNRNGTAHEYIASWESEKPRQLWKKSVGDGFSGPIVSQGAVILFHRKEDAEILEAFNSQTGTTLWQNDEKTSYQDDFGFDEGPRAVPCFSDGFVYAMGAEGTVRSVDFKTGKTQWIVATRDVYKARKGFFGMASSPLIFEDLLILNVGGQPGAGIIALDRKNGKLRWKSRDDEASYASPVIAALQTGKPHLIAFTREGLSVLNPGSGQQQAEFPWRAQMHASVNAANPLVIDDKIFLTASYGVGAVLLQWQKEKLTKVWSNDESISSHYATPVYDKGHLYGFHGRQEYGPSFRCVDFKTGKVLWNQDSFGAGTVTLSEGKLIILKESGELILAEASPSKFSRLGNTQILGSDTRAYPALSEKRLFARDKRALVGISLP